MSDLHPLFLSEPISLSPGLLFGFDPHLIDDVQSLKGGFKALVGPLCEGG